jgi:hypothetical protein
VLSRYVAQVFSELFWYDSSCPYYYWYHICFYVPLIISPSLCICQHRFNTHTPSVRVRFSSVCQVCGIGKYQGGYTRWSCLLNYGGTMCLYSSLSRTLAGMYVQYGELSSGKLYLVASFSWTTSASQSYLKRYSVGTKILHPEVMHRSLHVGTFCTRLWHSVISEYICSNLRVLTTCF